MKIQVYKDPDGNLNFEGKISKQYISKIYCECSSLDRNNLEMMGNLAQNTGRMSDLLMYLSELVRVNEGFNKPVKDLNELRNLQTLLE